MIKIEQVPSEVVWKLHNKLWGSTQFSVEEARAAIAAALNAWPGMWLLPTRNYGPAEIILPLMETRGDE